MRTILTKLILCVTGTFILIACCSCSISKHFKVGEYLNDLAYFTGVNLNNDLQDSFNSLKEYGVVIEEDRKILNDDLRLDFVKRTVNSFLKDEDKTNYFLFEINDSYQNNNPLVNKQEAREIIDRLVEEINNPNFEEKTIITEKDDVIHLDDNDDKNLEVGNIVYFDKTNEYKKITNIIDDEYVYEDASFEDVYEAIDIEGQYEIDFDNVEIIDFNDSMYFDNYETETSSSYTNSIYNLLAAKRHNFTKDGFNVAYTINSGSIDFRISKSIDKGITMFIDTSLSSIKPTYKWDNTKDNLDAFFKIDFDVTNEIGVSTGKYNNYYLDFKDLKGNNLLNSLKKLNSKSDALEASIPICTIKTPIPNVPTASFNIDVLMNFYMSGKIEVVLRNNGIIGFELKDNKFRLIHDVEKDYDFTLGASTRAVTGLNFNICSGNYRLMDIEMDAGVRAAITPIVHLFDDEGNIDSKSIDEEYYALYETTKENSDVALCGDLSLNWVLELNINTSKSLLYKYGFSKHKTIMDKSNQLFNNLTHIENFQFVKKCSQKNKQRIVKKESNEVINDEKIILDKYSIVIIKGKSMAIPIKSLPKGYSKDDLIYLSNNEVVASVNKNGLVDSQNLGSCKVTIKTKDDKYYAYLNILVSTG